MLEGTQGTATVTARANGSAGRRRLRALLGGVTSVATAIAIVGFSVALFFNPVWIGFEQTRAGVPAITGWSATDVEAVTGAILADLVLGPRSSMSSGRANRSSTAASAPTWWTCGTS